MRARGRRTPARAPRAAGRSRPHNRARGRARRRLEKGRRLRVEPAAQRVGQKRGERRIEIAASRSPQGSCGREYAARASRPRFRRAPRRRDRASLFASARAEKRRGRATGAALCPGQASDAEAAAPCAKICAAPSVGLDREVLLGQADRAELPEAPAAQAPLAGVEKRLVARLDAFACEPLDLLLRQRRRGENARRAARPAISATARKVSRASGCRAAARPRGHSPS